MPAPVFCRGQDCPLYKSIKEVSDTVELRYYDASHWISFTECDEHGGGGGEFMKLFHYIGGDNDMKMRIPMSTPILKQQIDENCHSMSFFKPFSIAAKDLPQPLDAGVQIISQPAQAYYVHAFGGYMDDAKFDQSMQAFDAAGMEITDDSVYSAMVAQYDARFQLFNRHNEVWMPASNVSIDEKAMQTFFSSAQAASHRHHTHHAHSGPHPPLWVHLLHVAFTGLVLIAVFSGLVYLVVRGVRYLQRRYSKKDPTQLDYLPVSQSDIDLVNAAFSLGNEKPEAEKADRINASGYTALE
ncbi:hypothetical protein SARC_00835 [Sphaeroforma arctica JP610]|uniref:Uncharacterized protein n=1 Tax=Sphaeroforma arctica JP610 TaxID=667725 RepID=A0A0L0GDE4_9EUKA|nr:hypothetical protein SARC_00835 [Sphaeroforma arctica JP610]KNC87025.1 hypothetical protein SARC_00835 [Sphaeroforma arctica JP610]|eukprot:XP_014160927.1 hypothetical protein SARC_00835 [Sphaeroforma arctica JP610]